MTVTEHTHLALAAIKQAIEPTLAEWVIGGSTSLMLRGLPLTAPPRDLDIYCDLEDVETIHTALMPYALDTPALSVTEMYRSVLSHYSVHGVQVELVGGFRVESSAGVYKTKVREMLLLFTEWVQLKDTMLKLPVVPLAHELWFNFMRGREDRVELIAKAYASSPAKHEAAFRAIEESNSFTKVAKETLRELLAK
ncbi:hypothetical protein [Paenibacillus sinopodophylli]|uniref:hypothetical protein n=1 Tax=Paenibacillus sinopodophylli TaxID=1837342 RepID=UPI00110D19B7|nr:hypothetical protein [Paenibacillus sinopodophylli]